MDKLKYKRYANIVRLLKANSSERIKAFNKNNHFYTIRTYSIEEYNRRCDILYLASVYDVISTPTWRRLFDRYCNEYYDNYISTNYGYNSRAIR